MHDAALHSVTALRTLEANAARRLGDAAVLMRRAGQAGWHLLLARWPQAMHIVVACGPGNNGGDGHELARLAQAAGRRVTVLQLPGQAPGSDLAREAAARFLEAGGEVKVFDGALPVADVIVDALFGIGLSRALDGEGARLVDAVNAASIPVLALDCPSGVDASTGTVPGPAVIADDTLEFLARKAGLATGAALDRVGRTHLADLGVEAVDFAGVEPVATCLVASDLPDLLPQRRRDSHKGHNGRVLCVGGDHGHGGAIVLASEAALRGGAGLVDVATRAAHVPALLSRLPEAMAHAIAMPVTGHLADLLATCDVVALGPGLGQADWGRALFAAALATRHPRVIDADGLNLLAAGPVPLAVDDILTPHPGEAARLLGCTVAQVQSDRLGAAGRLVERWGCTVVLKGAGTVVAAPERTARIIAAGNPGMAVGGMGDVLCGLVAALRGQGLGAFEAACLGALLHAAAGDAAAASDGARGLLPSDLMPWLRRLGNPSQSPQDPRHA
ncbi:NAD(P)H-hydrate dehydratase [Marilutibacter spongiae]|uniref:Bifunctional NAD(P)H-hydrate repair enzyme n=1 Tax=Marilutibacter spongiae TaxID=2025720 RepID=A0A7W3TLR9_9GAMM|nr:NAD(P)H-hydrate dehydratase [Lysobacter spongiae]MBB1060638.1 NAD(P)H-hydrate dehydratase [Lysobacter spongiae]